MKSKTALTALLSTAVWLGYTVLTPPVMLAAQHAAVAQLDNSESATVLAYLLSRGVAGLGLACLAAWAAGGRTCAACLPKAKRLSPEKKRTSCPC